ncbi:MAG: D-tyrosyl-tRNA(Tyr) deacylase [Bacteroidetes bacterium]|nr:D-tyrosyl-tRNA(Tyr) deacylase [Bacteroidota bacterium]
MRAVIQRVSQASVHIDGQLRSQIKQGLLVLLGIEELDQDEDIEWLCAKIMRMRIFSDAQGLMNLSLEDIQGDLLLISQFTLHASTKKGNRPSFIRAARPEQAIPLYEKMIQALESNLQKKIGTGIFGADMQVQLINDGPVTIIIDSKNKE